jgi:predicted  nucleic acid-binding Zn-ribbon protein
MADQKTARAELIAALVTDSFSGFKDGDESMLEGCSDARLEEFRAGSERAKSSAASFARLESENRNVSARLKVAEERIKAAEQGPTEEEWLQRAPASIKTLLEARKAEEDQVRSALVSQLKDLGANTEEELKKKSIDELKTLAKYARVDIPDFSGRGISVERHAQSMTDFTPPNAYEAGLKELREQRKRVN